MYDSSGTAISNTNSTVYTSAVVQNANTTGSSGISINGTLVNVGGYYTQLNYNCPATNATGSIAVDYTNPLDGTVVTSNTIPVTCSGGADSYTAKFDKSTYKPGEIATLTVTFKDSKGAIAQDAAYAGASGDITNNSTAPTVLGANLTPPGGTTGATAGAAGDMTTNGVKTYTFVVANGASIDGSYQATVSFPKVNAVSSVAQAAINVPYSIASGTTSLNDVLKGIVDLIASINKQIAAFAKLVTKKK